MWFRGRSVHHPRRSRERGCSQPASRGTGTGGRAARNVLAAGLERPEVAEGAVRTWRLPCAVLRCALQGAFAPTRTRVWEGG
jgi:hypothetical protein